MADVEAVAAQRALILAKELQFNSIVLEEIQLLLLGLFKLRNCLRHRLEISSRKREAMQKLSIVLK